jgi:hypothetical protein
MVPLFSSSFQARAVFCGGRRLWLSLYPVIDGESGFILYENDEILAIHMSVKTASGPGMETRATATVEIPPSSLAWSLVFPALSGITAEEAGRR